MGRHAPSPTGLLHLGHARSFLVAWLAARSRGGRLCMRLDDLDRSRVRPEFEAACLADLEWLGLDWDGPVLKQSSHGAEWAAVAHELGQRGLAYPCVCTRREVQEAIAAPHGDGPSSPYPGTCRGRFAGPEEARQASGREPALRFLVAPGEVTIHDELAGDFSQAVAALVGDFPLTSRDGQAAYQLAVVLDDQRAGVSEVYRGLDLLESTPRQALLIEALGFERPRWWHLGLVTDAAGQRLAKRRDDLSLAALRTAGVEPERLVGWLAGSLGGAVAPEGSEPCTAGDLVAGFDGGKLSVAPLAFDAAARSLLKFAP